MQRMQSHQHNRGQIVVDQFTIAFVTREHKWNDDARINGRMSTVNSELKIEFKSIVSTDPIVQRLLKTKLNFYCCVNWVDRLTNFGIMWSSPLLSTCDLLFPVRITMPSAKKKNESRHQWAIQKRISLHRDKRTFCLCCTVAASHRSSTIFSVSTPFSEA